MLSLFLGRPRTRQRHLDALDGLRGLAVLVVIGSHLSNVGMLPRPGLSGTGKSGVYLFFVLSAYLLTRILLQRPLLPADSPPQHSLRLTTVSPQPVTASGSL